MALPIPPGADATAIVACINDLLEGLGTLPPSMERIALQIGGQAFVLVGDPGEQQLVQQPAGEARSLDATLVFRTAADCCAVARGELSPQQAFGSGRLQVKGRLSALLALQPHLAKLGESVTRSGLVGRGSSSFSGSSFAGSNSFVDGTCEWMPNEASKSCMGCGVAFSIVRRRHHCRGCGKLFCAQCSPKYQGVRQCSDCVQTRSVLREPQPVVTTAGSNKDFEEMVRKQLKILEQRLEDMETSSARQEADAFVGNAMLCSILAYVAFFAVVSVVATSRIAVPKVLAGLGVQFVLCWLLVRHIRAVWYMLLILWKLYWAKFESKRLCDADSKKLLSSRHRVMAAIAVRALRELGGVWPKVGQYLSTQGDQWPDEVLLEFSKLRDSMPAATMKICRKTIEEDLRRPMDKIFKEFAEKPIASASIGQVHRATLLDGKEAAVKIQHRHAARQIPVDVLCMRLIAYLVWILTLGEIDAMPVMVEWLGAVIEELDFHQEAKSQIRGRAELNAAGVDVVVPEVYESLCGRRVLIMEFIEGHQVTRDDDLIPEERLAVMTQLVRAYAHGLFVAGHFNGDPHAGNLLVERSSGRPRCVLLDWGLTKTLAKERREASCQLIVATGMKDTCAIIDAFRRLGLNFSQNADPEPDMLMMMLRHLSLIEKQTEARKITEKVSGTIDHAVRNKMDIHTKIDSYTGDFFFFFRVATLIKGLSAILDIRADFLDIFIETSRNALRGPPPASLTPGLALSTSGRARCEAQFKSLIEEAVLRSEAVGVQVAIVTADGRPKFSAAYGMVSYISWQALQRDYGFPLGAPWLARPIIAAATAAALQKKGISLDADIHSAWPEFQGPRGTSIRRIIEGGDPLGAHDVWTEAPSKPFTRLLGDGSKLAALFEKAAAISLDASSPPWWPPVAHAVACSLLLRAARAEPLPACIRDLFHEACGNAVACSPASASPVKISKPIMSVESAEVMASQDALLAATGNEELRCIHLMDPCLANNDALRNSETMPCGLAASAANIATLVAQAHRSNYVDRRLWATADDLGCIKRCSVSGNIAVVLVSCANADLASKLADLVLQ